MTSRSMVLKRGLDQAAGRNALIILSLLAVAVLTRASHLGDPALYEDEQFYLLVADRMWHGALPYVDIWDRKPILLFLIYAALRPFSSDGIVAYQTGAMLFATATAFVIVIIAQRFAHPRGAWLAGIAYLLYMQILKGEGGQTPVFYNLFLSLGALEVFRAGESHNQHGVMRHGLFSMVWAGLAIQVKYTAIFEGVAFGLWLLALMIKQNRTASIRTVSVASLWIMVALTPTLLAAGFYASIGHLQPFIQANFLSIFLKQQPADFPVSDILWVDAVKLAPLLIVSSFSIPLLFRRDSNGTSPAFLLLWTAFSIVDFFAIGNYCDHYALPFTVPAVIACAPLLELALAGTAATAFFAIAANMSSAFFSDSEKQSHRDAVTAIVEAVKPFASKGCIYLYNGPSVVYSLTHSCLPTRYVFPGHLSEIAEARATHATSSMAELLASRPSAILIADKPLLNAPPNSDTAEMIHAVLETDYERVKTLPDVIASRHQILYARKDLLTQAVQGSVSVAPR